MDWLIFLPFMAASLAAAATGALFPPGTWYDNLSKPPWTPPPWAFPVMWTALYIASSIAATRVAGQPGNGAALAFWSMQIAFNALWSPVFFGLRHFRASLGAMVGLWIAVAATMVAFFQLDTVAGWLFVPYLAWVTTAAALNISVVRRNPDVEPISLSA
ncbi:MAG: TspO/MBR family protein [Pseudomonadota bacterium]